MVSSGTVDGYEFIKWFMSASRSNMSQLSKMELLKVL